MMKGKHSLSSFVVTRFIGSASALAGKNRTNAVATSILAATTLLGVYLAMQAPVATAAENGFVSLFNGKDLDGWDGDPRFWRVEDNAIVGETTADNKAEQNTFLIHRGGEFADFELRFRYQVKGYNSGVQYRSVDQGDWVVSGYQCDFEDRWHQSVRGPIDKFSGMFFDEKGRGILGQRGEVVIVRPHPDNSEKAMLDKIGSVGDPVQLEKHIH